MARRRLAGAAAVTIALPLLAVIPASQAVAAPSKPAPTPVNDTRELTREDFTVDGKKLDLPEKFSPRVSAQRTLAAAETPPVGTVRQWLGLDDVAGGYYRKNYTLRAVGEHIEVWVANDVAFPEGDCRNQIASTTEITDAQVESLASEFDTNMYPKESEAFSVAPDRDGSNAILGPGADGNGGDYSGAGNKTVTLVDNVRDDNYYEFPAAPTYIAGFFSSQLNELFDRNVMTIDAYDWLHRTGANPPNEPTADPCTSRTGRPHLYESTFAHEYQHLLHYYTDPFEGTWINEGLSDFAQTLVGYVDTTLSIDQTGADSHIYCFQGWGTVAGTANPNPRACGGPENSLTLWGEDPDPNAVLADYGNAYSFMLFLFDRYGADITSKLHQDGDHQGLASLDAVLEEEGVHDMWSVVHDFQTMNLVDKPIGDARFGIMLGVDKDRVTTESLRATVNLANPATNATPGAAPNGADYVLLQKANGKPLKGLDLRSLKFKGAKTLPPVPLSWTVVDDDPDHVGNPAIWSGNGNNIDAAAVASVSVPASDPTLRFDAKYGAEAGFDYGYVVVSTDGGATYTPIAGDKTVDGPLGPSVNGTTVGFEPHSYDLSAYAGQDILVGFRYVSDGGVNEGGWLIDDVTVGDTTVSDGSSLTPFKSTTEINPTAVANWNVRLIGINEKLNLAWQFEWNGKSDINLGLLSLILLLPFDKVVAVVAYDEPTEQVRQFAPYTLTVNGVVQPGGAPLS